MVENGLSRVTLSNLPVPVSQEPEDHPDEHDNSKHGSHNGADVAITEAPRIVISFFEFIGRATNV